MLVFRSDLLTGFKNKLFETDVKDIDNFGLSLDDNILVCNFTSRVVKNGYKISGYILNNVLYNQEGGDFIWFYQGFHWQYISYLFIALLGLKLFSRKINHISR